MDKGKSNDEGEGEGEGKGEGEGEGEGESIRVKEHETVKEIYIVAWKHTHMDIQTPRATHVGNKWILLSWRKTNPEIAKR